jgi:hypothetical protein
MLCYLFEVLNFNFHNLFAFKAIKWRFFLIYKFYYLLDFYFYLNLTMKKWNEKKIERGKNTNEAVLNKYFWLHKYNKKHIE